MSGAYQSGEPKASEPRKCFVAHSYQAEWHDTIEAVCDELLPKYGLQPWYAEYNYDLGSTTLLDKIVSMIDSAPYGIYDLSYWRANERSPWIMPCNVLIELGIAIALNRPTILLRHTGNRIAKIELPKSIQSVTQICEFTGGDYSLEKALREHLSRQANLPTDYDWQHHRCHFGEINCSYLQVYPHSAMIGHDKLHCYIADGPDTDQPDFRHAVETVLGKFNNISYSYLDKRSVPSGYTFLLCSHCQLIRSTPFAIYRLTPDTSPDTYIAIGISIGLEYRFHYKIPRFMITKDMQYVPSLLQGYQCVPVKNLHALKTRLPQFVQQVMAKMDGPTYWRPQGLPLETRDSSNLETGYESVVEKNPLDTTSVWKPVSVFICYEYEDVEMFLELVAHLDKLERKGFISYLYNIVITSDNVGNSRNICLREAKIILPLVSPYFIGSDYVYNVEMRTAMERYERGEALVIPIILRPALWKDTLFGNLQTLPRSGRSVMQWRNRDRAYAKIATEIEKIVHRLREGKMPFAQSEGKDILL